MPKHFGKLTEAFSRCCDCLTRWKWRCGAAHYIFPIKSKLLFSFFLFFHFDFLISMMFVEISNWFSNEGNQNWSCQGVLKWYIISEPQSSLQFVCQALKMKRCCSHFYASQRNLVLVVLFYFFFTNVYNALDAFIAKHHFSAHIWTRFHLKNRNALRLLEASSFDSQFWPLALWFSVA